MYMWNMFKKVADKVLEMVDEHPRIAVCVAIVAMMCIM